VGEQVERAGVADRVVRARAGALLRRNDQLVGPCRTLEAPVAVGTGLSYSLCNQSWNQI